MIQEIKNEIMQKMLSVLDNAQLEQLSEVLDIAESSGLIRSSDEYEGEYRVTDTRRLGCCGCSAFCDSAEEATMLQKDYLAGCVSLSDKLSVRVYKYVHVCDRGYYVHDDSFDYM